MITRFAEILDSARNIILEWSLKLKSRITGKGFRSPRRKRQHSRSVVYNINT